MLYLRTYITFCTILYNSKSTNLRELLKTLVVLVLVKVVVVLVVVLVAPDHYLAVLLMLVLILKTLNEQLTQVIQQILFNTASGLQHPPYTFNCEQIIKVVISMFYQDVLFDPVFTFQV